MWDWLNCVVLFRHEYGIWCENGAMFLRCLRCGHRSQGWSVENHTTPHDADHRHSGRFPVIARRHA